MSFLDIINTSKTKQITGFWTGELFIQNDGDKLEDFHTEDIDIIWTLGKMIKMTKFYMKLCLCNGHREVLSYSYMSVPTGSN